MRPGISTRARAMMAAGMFFVAACDADEAVEGVATSDELDRVGDDSRETREAFIP